MAMQLTIKAPSGYCLFASESSVLQTYVVNNGTREITIGHDGTEGGNPFIQYARFRKYDEYGVLKKSTSFVDSLVIEVVYTGTAKSPGHVQEVILYKTDTSTVTPKGATWGITYHESGVDVDKQLIATTETETTTKKYQLSITNNCIVNVTAKTVSSVDIDNTSLVSEVTVAGYWQNNVGGIDGGDTAHLGTHAKPVDWPSNHQDSNNYPISISWTQATKNANPLEYVIVIEWKGWSWGANQIGAIFILDENSKTFLDRTTWWDGSSNQLLLFTVHNMYSDIGMRPQIQDANDEQMGRVDDNTGFWGSVPQWGIWRRFAAAGSLVKAHFYDYNNGSPKLLYDDLGNAQIISLPINKGKLDVVAPIDIRPEGKEDWILSGWYKGNDSSSPDITTKIDVGNLGTIGSTDIYIFAIYEKPSFTITYHSKTTPEETVVIEYQVGAENRVAENTFEKVDYTFMSWNTKSNGTGDSYRPGDIWEGIQNAHLYAQWQSTWQKTISGLYFIHHKRPKVKIAAKRLSLEHPDYVSLVVYPELCELKDVNGVDKNYVSNIRTIRCRPEKRRDTTWQYNYLYNVANSAINGFDPDDPNAGLPCFNGDNEGDGFEDGETNAASRGVPNLLPDGSIAPGTKGPAIYFRTPSRSEYRYGTNDLFRTIVRYDASDAPKSGETFKTNSDLYDRIGDGELRDGWGTLGANGPSKLFDIDKEYQIRATIQDALEFRSRLNYESNFPVREGDKQDGQTHPGETVEIVYQDNDPSSGVFSHIKGLNGNTLSCTNSTTKVIPEGKTEYDFVPYNFTESTWSNTALLPKYVTKLFVHNPFMMDKIKESGRVDRNDTDYWQIREHIQDSKLTRDEVLDSNNNPILKRRSDPRSVNGFSRDEIDKLIIPTLKRNLAEADLGERLVFDFSQEEKLIALIQRINDTLTKTANEIFGFGGITDYKYNDYFDLLTVGKYEDQHKYEQRILDADGERHGTTNNAWVTESDTSFNRVVDTPYKEVVLKDFSNEQRTETLDTNVKIVSTIDHIYDYDVSLIDLERSLSDWLYILYRMIERQEGDEGANSPDFNNRLADKDTLISTYRNADNTGWKSNAFRNWDGTHWLKPENDIAEYQTDLGDDWGIIRNSNLNPGAFDNNGCKADCMGLCQSGCYSSCVGNCKTACGTSCFFTCDSSCGSSCSRDCTSSCAQNCASDCINSCTGNCSGSCTDSCQGNCDGSCTGGCGGTCKGTCISTCSGGCTGTAACTDGCSSTCAQQCATGCTGDCSGSCANGCGTTCSGVCKGNCTEDCHNTCRLGCGGGCDYQCEKTCSGTCDSSCLGTCRERCTGGCERYCQDTCRGTCKVNCGSNCTGSCVSNCAFSCVGGCYSTCKSQCSDQCYNMCKDFCKVGCSDTCGVQCIESCFNTCTQQCQNNCGVGCDTKCASNCMNNCNSTCGKSCQGTCNDGCKGTCQEQCAEQCGANCNATCGQSCRSGCGNTCTGTCGYSCWATCSTDCQGSAKLLVGKP